MISKKTGRIVHFFHLQDLVLTHFHWTSVTAAHRLLKVIADRGVVANCIYDITIMGAKTIIRNYNTTLK